MTRLFISFYVVLFGLISAYSFIADMSIERWLSEMMVIDKTNDYIVVFYLIENLHESLDKQEFDAVIENFPSQSNTPLKMFDVNSINFSPKLFNSDSIYVADEYNDLLYYRFNNSDLVARIGPLSTYEPLTEYTSWYESGYYPFLALGIFAWIFLFHRKINRLDKAATEFGKGNLLIRVSQKGRHRVGNLNHSFNLMASQIEQLVQGHKNLTNAVAHELRTPMARIRFQLDMLYNEQDKQQCQEYMFGISDDLNELSDLVDELLTFAKFDREPIPKLHVNSLNDSINNVIRSRHFDSNVKINYREQTGKFDLAPFEPRNLERAIGNLLTNAQKYTRDTVDIIIEHGKKHITIYVDDNGPGIPRESRNNIFQPFKRLDDSRTRETGGYGLGLAIVKQIAVRHRGEISIDTSPIGGARFKLSWPRSTN
jgi:two-component system, OmpR family, sensor histidine kinase RstB